MKNICPKCKRVFFDSVKWPKNAVCLTCEMER